MSFRYDAVTVAFALSMASAQAAVTAQEAEQLKTTLTPMGAEKAGNRDGTIPPWVGGDTTVPAGYVSGHPRPEPFAGERPLLSITSANSGQYASKLPAGALELLKRLPDFKIDVFPTHRTAAAPQFVYDYTIKNATSVSLTDNGNGVSGGFGGVLFPIPKNGNEVLWNSKVHWQGTIQDTINFAYVISSNGSRVLVASTHGWNWDPYYDVRFDPSKTGTGLPDNAFEKSYVTTLAPAFNYGQGNVFYQTLDPGRDGTPAWQYLVGQRRVRRAPNLQYDTPNSIFSGISNFDEFNGFYGSPDHYAWHLLGKKEMYIPYNENKITNMSADQLLGPKAYNADTIRWELHRVWVVEGDLAPGSRDTVPKRTMYIDEDSWQIAMQDEYDANGRYWKFVLNTLFDLPEFPATSAGGAGFIWDFHAGNYQAITYPPGSVAIAKSVIPPASFFTAEHLASSGTR